MANIKLGDRVELKYVPKVLWEVVMVRGGGRTIHVSNDSFDRAPFKADILEWYKRGASIDSVTKHIPN